MKLVKEHIDFERGKDPFKAMGIGTTTMIQTWLEDNRVRNYIINDDRTIDVINDLLHKGEKYPRIGMNRSDVYVNDGRVEIHEKNLTEFPDYIQFNLVEGYFAVNDCDLTTLRGCPRIVYNNFWCSRNKLTTLDYCPKKVGGSFICHHNAVEFTKDYVLSKCNTNRSTIQSK